jgi:light-regulated signal transduction histidine kinase (bacteriophytochrome)
MQIELRELAVSAATIESCDQELIHTPNVIQAHGAVLIADVDSLRITHASANLQQFLARAPEWAIGRQLQDVIGTAAMPTIEPELAESAASIGNVLTLAGGRGRMLNVLAHRTGQHLFIDLLPVTEDAVGSPLPSIHDVLEALMSAKTCDGLCNLAVKALRTASGFDRVMAYRFGPEGEGKIIAEAKIDSLEPFLGMTYPADDIPPQARALYVRNRVGAIADFNYIAVPLLVDPACDDSVPIDMTLSSLRGISPIHCQYMRNMNVAASLTIAIVHRDRLWGMLVCHHNTPRIVTPELRSVAKLQTYVIGSRNLKNQWLDYRLIHSLLSVM